MGDNKEIIITCLMMNDIKHKLEKLLGKVAQKEASIIAFIR